MIIVFKHSKHYLDNEKGTQRGPLFRMIERFGGRYMVQDWEVIVMKGESEPWWLFPEWREDIIEHYTFGIKEKALEQYLSIFKKLHAAFDYVKIKNTSQAAFWNEGETSFCTHCDDDLQIYVGLLILAYGHPYQFGDTDQINLDNITDSTKREIP